MKGNGYDNANLKYEAQSKKEKTFKQKESGLAPDTINPPPLTSLSIF